MRFQVRAGLFLLLSMGATLAGAQVDRARCDTTIKNDSLKYAKEDIQTKLVEQSFQPKETFAPDAKVECHLDWKLFSTEPMEQYQVERGVKNGVPYDVYYSDGSGSIPNNPENVDDYLKEWHFSCKKDPIEDTKSCYANFSDLFIYQDGKGSPIVHLGGQSYPGSELVIRFDGGTPIRASAKTGFSKEQSAKIVAALKTAKKVVTRWQEWPSAGNKDEEWNVYNFPLVLERLQWGLEAMR